MRREHQTKQAATGVRTKKVKTDSSPETTMRGKIIRELHEVLKEVQDDVAIGTGADRGRRWTDNSTPAAPIILPGNAANAALAAATVAKKVSTFVTVSSYHTAFNVIFHS